MAIKTTDLTERIARGMARRVAAKEAATLSSSKEMVMPKDSKVWITSTPDREESLYLEYLKKLKAEDEESRFFATPAASTVPTPTTWSREDIERAMEEISSERWPKEDFEREYMTTFEALGGAGANRRDQDIARALQIIKKHVGPGVIDQIADMSPANKLAGALMRCASLWPDAPRFTREHGMQWAAEWSADHNLALDAAFNTGRFFAVELDRVRSDRKKAQGDKLRELERGLRPKSEHSPEHELEIALDELAAASDPDAGAF